MSESTLKTESQDVTIPQLDHLNVVFERHPNPQLTTVHLDVQLVFGKERVNYVQDNGQVVQVRYGYVSDGLPHEPLAYALAGRLFADVPGIVSTDYVQLEIGHRMFASSTFGNYEIRIPKGLAFDDAVFEAGVLAVLTKFFGLTDDRVAFKVDNPMRVTPYSPSRAFYDGLGVSGSTVDYDGDSFNGSYRPTVDVKADVLSEDDPGYNAAVLSDYSDPVQLKAALMPYRITDPMERSSSIAKAGLSLPFVLTGVAGSKAGRRAIIDRLAELGELTPDDARSLLSGGDKLDDFNPDYVHLLGKDASSGPTA